MAHLLAPLLKEDWPAVVAIYREGLATGLAAFMTDPPSWRAWDDKQLPVGRIVAREPQGAVVGWAALAPAPDT